MSSRWRAVGGERAGGRTDLDDVVEEFSTGVLDNHDDVCRRRDDLVPARG